MAKKFQPSYTVEDILTLYQLRKDEGDEGRLRDLATQFRELTRLDRPVSIPTEYKKITKEVRTPFIRDAHHRITSSLVAKQPVAHITPRNDKKAEYRLSANIAERFDMAMIERGNKERGTDIIYDLTAALVRDGESVLKVVHRKDAWANFPVRVSDMDADAYTEKAEEYKRGVDLPIAWRDVDRLSMVCEGGEYGDNWVIEYGEYTKPYLKSTYGMVKDEKSDRLIDPKHVMEGKGYPEGLAPTNSAVRSIKMEFFDAYEWHVIIDGSEAPGFPKRNPYSPHLPYFRAAAYNSESLLYSLLFLVPRLDELLTMKLNWAILGSYPTPVIETVPNSNAFPGLDTPLGSSGDGGADGQKPLTWAPGKLMELPLGKRLYYLTAPPIGADTNELIQIFKSLIDIAGIPSVMRGISGSGDSGYLANQMRAAAEMAYKLAAIAAQRQLEKATEFSHWLISNVINQTVYVHGWDNLHPKTGRPTRTASKEWIGLDPKKQASNIGAIDMLGPVTFSYRPTLPTNEQANAMIAMQLTNAENPLSSVRHALETYLQEEDPDSIMEEMTVEKAVREEPLVSIVRDEALRQAGIIPPPPPVPPTNGLLDQFGRPMAMAGQISPGMQGIPLANEAMPGTAGVPYITTPGQPVPQQEGVGVGVGGRRAEMYPGQPGGPNQ